MPDKTNLEMLIEKYEEKHLKDREGYPHLNYAKKAVMAQLYENYFNAKLAESTVTGDVDKFDPMVLPAIRRGVPNLVPMDIFGTQPFTQPSGLFFCLRAVHQNTTAYPIKRSNSVALILADATNFTENGAISTNGTGAGVGTVRYKEGNKLLVQITSGTFAAGDSVDNVSSYSSAETTVSSVFDNEAMYRYIFSNYMGFTSVAASEFATNQREMGIKIDKVSATADSYKLKAKYSDTLMQDMRAQQGMDAEQELIRIMSREAMIEQNRKFIDYLNVKAALGGTTAWNHASLAYGGDADGRWAAEKIFSFYQYINKIANQIVKTTLQGRGNFLVCSLDVASMLETLRHWKASTISDGIGDVDLGQNAFVGTLGGKYKVYVDMYADSDYVTIGYKGASEWDAGIYYGPYVPLYLKRGQGEEDGEPRLFFHTRYALADNPFGAHLYYRKINVTL